MSCVVLAGRSWCEVHSRQAVNLSKHKFWVSIQPTAPCSSKEAMEKFVNEELLTQVRKQYLQSWKPLFLWTTVSNHKWCLLHHLCERLGHSENARILSVVELLLMVGQFICKIGWLGDGTVFLSTTNKKYSKYLTSVWEYCKSSRMAYVLERLKF